MVTLTVTAKGQITLKKDLLGHLGVEPGDKIQVEKLPNGRVQVSAERPRGKLSDLFGSLDGNGHHLSIEDMNRIIEEGWAGKR